MATKPTLSLQTATLYTSNPAGNWTGTGGPFGFSPFTGQFGGTVSSAGITAEPFDDTLFDVAPGDDITFLIAIQNLTPGLAAPNLTLLETAPTGFVVPPDGIGLTVTDGLGNDLATSGSLFAPGGLTITPPLAAYDPNSAQNVDLVTFSLDAGPALPGPYATLTATAALLGTSTTATTTLVSAAPNPVVTPESDPSAVAAGQTISFDVSVTIPAGTLSNLTITPVLPNGVAALTLVSNTLVAIGPGLAASTPLSGPNGAISFASITSNPANGASTTVQTRITLRATAAASGPATLQTVVSAAAPTAPGGLWTASVSSSVGVIVPPPPPTLSGLAPAFATLGHPATPFAGLAVSDAAPSQPGTIAITLQNPALGHLANPTTGTLDPAGDTFFASGPLSALQAAAAQLQFVPAAVGTEAFTVTLIDSAGGTAQAAASLAITPPAPDPLFDPAYYLAHNPDVAAAGVDPYQHYTVIGWMEGRDPDPLFDSRAYLAQNPDVKAAGVDPLTHFEMFGWKEGREPSLVFDDKAYLAANPDVAAAAVDPLLHYLQFGQYEGRTGYVPGAVGTLDLLVVPAFYDPQLGATLLPTGPAAQQQATDSFDTSGWQQGLDPDPFFDTAWYLAHNPDVAAAHVNPLLHFEQFGWKEGRDPSAAFSTAKYLAAYPDVKAAGVDPLLHYVLFGQFEGRHAFPIT